MLLLSVFFSAQARGENTEGTGAIEFFRIVHTGKNGEIDPAAGLMHVSTLMATRQPHCLNFVPRESTFVFSKHANTW